MSILEPYHFGNSFEEIAGKPRLDFRNHTFEVVDKQRPIQIGQMILDQMQRHEFILGAN
jgi:hypothetical protein